AKAAPTDTPTAVEQSPTSEPSAAAAITASDAPRIAIHAVTDLSYPMAHCRVPLIDHITVDNAGENLRGAVLQLEVTSADGAHGEPSEIHLDLAAHAPTT